MVTEIPFVFVDVFAPRPLAGNPVSVVPDADGLDESQQKAIAREFNQSETTFVLKPSVAGADWRLRSFTPAGVEVFGAGHNALGTWLWLVGSGRVPADRDRFVQQLGDHLLPLRVTRDPEGVVTVAMDQATPVFGATVEDPDALATALNLTVADLAVEHPAQVISTGAGHLLVPLRNRAAVDAAAPHSSRLKAVVERVGGHGCYLYSLDPVDPAEAIAYTRFFNPTMGITEEPASATAAGPLVVRLVGAGIVADGATVVVEQGHRMGRPSRITVTVAGELVRISGTGVVVAEGRLHL